MAGLSPSRSTRPDDLARGSARPSRRRPSLLLSVALAGVLGVADQAGRPADQDQRPVPGLLQPPGGDQLHEVAHVQARRGRVEADVEGDRAPVELGAQRVADRSSGRAARAPRGRPGRAPGHVPPGVGGADVRPSLPDRPSRPRTGSRSRDPAVRAPQRSRRRTFAHRIRRTSAQRSPRRIVGRRRARGVRRAALRLYADTVSSPVSPEPPRDVGRPADADPRARRHPAGRVAGRRAAARRRRTGRRRRGARPIPSAWVRQAGPRASDRSATRGPRRSRARSCALDHPAGAQQHGATRRRRARTPRWRTSACRS